MAGLSRKDLGRVLASLESQGCELVKTTNGTQVRLPDGKSITFHKSDSDRRAILNQRARVRRAGLIWPFDDNKKETSMETRRQVSDVG